MIDNAITRRIVGTALAVLAIGGGRVIGEIATRVPGAYTVEARLGEAAGAGLGPGSDVKLRGVRIGSVVDLRLDDDATAVATLQLLEEPPVPATAVPVVTAKTLLGEKQVELRIDGDLAPPYLAAGDVLRVPDGGEPTELETVLATLQDVFEGIDEDRLATLVEAFGSFDDADAEVVRRNIELGEELSAFADRTAATQVQRLATFADVLEALADRGDDLTRMNRALPDATAVVSERQAAIRASLGALSAFARTLAGFLEVEEPAIDRLFDLSDVIGRSLDPRIHEIGRMIQGIYRYSLIFGHHGGSLTDGSEHAWFKAFLGEEGTFNQICEGLPDELEQAAPGCVPEDIEDRGGSGDPP